VDGPPARLAHRGHCSGQELEAVGPLPLRVGVRKVLADVAQPGRAEQRVGTGVGDGVGVAVTVETALAVEAHTGEYQRAVGIVREPVDVEPEPDPHRHSASASTMSAGTVTLMLVAAPATHTPVAPAAAASDTSSVPSGSPSWARVITSRRKPWGVCTATNRARS